MAEYILEVSKNHKLCVICGDDLKGKGHICTTSSNDKYKNRNKFRYNYICRDCVGEMMCVLAKDTIDGWFDVEGDK